MTNEKKNTRVRFGQIRVWTEFDDAEDKREYEAKPFMITERLPSDREVCYNSSCECRGWTIRYLHDPHREQDTSTHDDIWSPNYEVTTHYLEENSQVIDFEDAEEMVQLLRASGA